MKHQASEGESTRNQWRVETLQLVNWGGFAGHHSIGFAPGTTLLSGASGTGKSTLLDAYIAIMMDSTVPFNGASNNATIGRARGTDQRSLISYLRGKVDTTRDASGELSDQVLRGADTATWGALAVTFIDDEHHRYTVARLYYVPRSATKDGEITRKPCTVEGVLDLREIEPFVPGKFDKRAVKARFANLEMHDSYTVFAQTIFTRLGIGASGDGSKALRLLARIQGGHKVSTVDDLYKSMVIEDPPTYAAADHATAHFEDLEDAYKAMETEEKKVAVLGQIPELHQQRDAALENERLIDTFGLSSPGDSSFLLWRLTTEDTLLEAVEEKNRLGRADAAAAITEAKQQSQSLTARLQKVQQDLARNESHGLIQQIDDEIGRLETDLDQAAAQRSTFEERTARLGLAIDNAEDFAAAQVASERFLAGFEARATEIAGRKTDLLRRQFAPSEEKKSLKEEQADLEGGREGRMDPRLHRSRMEIAQATGIDPDELPFVGELIDVLPDHKEWRKAIETTLFGLSRVLLIDNDELDRVSRIIDPLRLQHRVNYEGVVRRPFAPRPKDVHYVSGKLDYRDTPFTAWVQDRITAKNTDALCVDRAEDLGGTGRRVTINGQTRQDRSGAHGELRAPNVIGFSSKERLEEIEHRLGELEAELKSVDPQLNAVDREYSDLYADKYAYDIIRTTDWRTIDHDGIAARVSQLRIQRQDILDADDTLRTLQATSDDLEAELEEQRVLQYGAEEKLRRLEADRQRTIKRKDHVLGQIERIERDQSVVLSDHQADYLSREYAQVATVGDLAALEDGIKRLRAHLLRQGAEAHDRVTSLARQLENTFRQYLEQWPDPNLSATVDDYSSFSQILAAIRSTGLHERRTEWTKRLTDWSGQDLVPLAGAFSMAIGEIQARLDPVNDILRHLPFGARRYRLRIDLRELHRDDLTKFKRELAKLSRADIGEFTDEQIQRWFNRLSRFIHLIRKDSAGNRSRDGEYFLDVRRHIEISAVAYDEQGIGAPVTYTSLGGKSGGESQELVAFIVGAALRFQLGNAAETVPRFAPVFLDEGFVKADSDFTGRSVDAWKGLGFQLVIGAPFGQFTALEPHADLVLYMSKNPKTERSTVIPLPPAAEDAHLMPGRTV
ncbi:ATP-binding protein [Kribbella sp. NPDC004536]|uniref:ATP-binding protein n=1 Tax=Kribbella sp. NPDC004536 TaxID=3364106 RepID=UPI003681BBD3